MSPDSNDAPQRIGIISDVHGNLPALEAVIAAADAAGIGALWCLGDIVGYGGQPDACVALVRERCQVCLAGNHDLGVLDTIDISDFSPHAAAAALWTRENASTESLDFLRSLEPSRSGMPIGLFHGSPRDPVWEYVLSTSQAHGCIVQMDERVAAIGHTHVALHFTEDDEGISGEAMPADSEADLSSDRWLINPGSVGQPRDGDPRAAWLELDTASWRARWHRAEYPIDAAAAAIERAGLPRSLGDRLHIGQ